MDTQEREAYRNFVRTFYQIIYHMPPYASANDYQRLLHPLLEDAEALIGSEEISELQKRSRTNGGKAGSSW